MFGKASSSQQSGFSGSGTLSHVYIQSPPLRCSISGSSSFFYDDGSKLLLAATSDQVLSWKTVPFDPLVVPSSTSIREGPILLIRYSLDSKLLAIQRSDHDVQILDREGAEIGSYRSQSEAEVILGFFWTDCPSSDIVIVKTSGLVFLSYKSHAKSLTIVDTKKMNVSWYVYTHESRLVLLASGMQCKSVTGYQVSSAGIIRLPRFEMLMAKCEANSKPVLSADDIHIVTVYGRIYCLQFDKIAMLLHLYRFYRDAVIQQGSLPIYSERIAVSMVDSVLLIHQVDAKVVIIYDIFADSRAPLSAPLPLLLRGFRAISSSQAVGKSAENSSEFLNDTQAMPYGDGWVFLVPDLICDVKSGLLWKLHLDLEALSTSCSDIPHVLEFLQRRKLEAPKAKQLCLALARSLILERRPLPTVVRAIDVLVSSYMQSIKTGSYYKRTKVETESSASNPNGTSTIAENAVNQPDASVKSSRQETMFGVGNDFTNTGHASNSDSEDNFNYATQKFDALKLDSSGGKIDRTHMMTTETSGDEVCSASSQSRIINQAEKPLKANMTENLESQVTSAAISPDDFYTYVFAVVEEEMAGDASYFVSIIVEFLRRVNLEKLKVHPNLYILTVQLLARNERHVELGFFLITKIIEPSKEIALQLLELGRQDFQTRKLGLDMLRQLSLHDEYIVVLVQDGYYIEALRYARKNKVNTVRPSLFLEACCASNDSQHLAAVLRFFSDFVHDFKSTPDYERYHHVLVEMGSINNGLIRKDIILQ